MTKKINPVVYITCGVVVTLSMVIIKLTAWSLHKAVLVFLLHE